MYTLLFTIVLALILIYFVQCWLHKLWDFLKGIFSFGFPSVPGSELISTALTTGLEILPGALNDVLPENLSAGLESLPNILNEGGKGVLNDGHKAYKGIESIVNSGVEAVLGTPLQFLPVAQDFLSSPFQQTKEKNSETKTITIKKENKPISNNEALEEDVSIQAEVKTNDKDFNCDNLVVTGKNENEDQQLPKKEHKGPKLFGKFQPVVKELNKLFRDKEE